MPIFDRHRKRVSIKRELDRFKKECLVALTPIRKVSVKATKRVSEFKNSLELDKKDLDIAFANLDKRIQRLQYRQEKYGIKTPIKALDASLSSVVNVWSKGCDFEELSQYTDASDGDIVRGLRLAINLLRQIKWAIPQHESLHNFLLI